MSPTPYARSCSNSFSPILPNRSVPGPTSASCFSSTMPAGMARRTWPCPMASTLFSNPPTAPSCSRPSIFGHSSTSRSPTVASRRSTASTKPSAIAASPSASNPTRSVAAPCFTGGHVGEPGCDQPEMVSLGQPFNVFPPAKMDLYRRTGIGGIIRMSRDGKEREVFAWGVRNSVGMDFNPKDRTLWFTDNQVDGMGDDQPPGELNRADKPGMNFGFPYYGGGKTRTTEYKDQQAPADVTFPQVEMAPHAADLGMTFYSGQMFPQAYRGGVFNAQHGSWNRTTPAGARVMFTSLKEDGTADKTEVFAEGWLTENGEYLGRPVDVAQLPDGSMLVSDDFAGAIYRIWYEGR